MSIKSCEPGHISDDNPALGLMLERSWRQDFERIKLLVWGHIAGYDGYGGGSQPFIIFVSLDLSLRCVDGGCGYYRGISWELWLGDNSLKAATMMIRRDLTI